MMNNKRQTPIFPANRETTFEQLIMMKDSAEKTNRSPFEDFTDRDMLHYYVYQQKNVDQNKNRNERTVKEYERELTMMVKQLIEHAAEINLDIEEVTEGSLFKSMGARHLRRYQQWLVEESPYVKKRGRYSAATISRKTVVWKSFFQFLHQSGYIMEAVHEGLLSATVRKDDRPNRDLGPGEVISILDYCEEVKHDVLFSMVHVLVGTGMRNEEFCKLKMSDVKYDHLLGGFYLDVTGKGNKKREIPLKEKVMRSIIQYRKARFLSADFPNDSMEPLFPTGTGKAFSPPYLAKYLGNALERLNLSFMAARKTRITAHVFRHSFAIISYLNGADIYDIMRALGHEKIETTMIYLQKIMDREKHAIHKWKDGSLGRYI